MKLLTEIWQNKELYLAAGLIALAGYIQWLQRKVRVSEAKNAKQAADAETAPLKADIATGEERVDALDKKALAEEARLLDCLNRRPPGSS